METAELYLVNGPKTEWKRDFLLNQTLQNTFSQLKPPLSYKNDPFQPPDLRSRKPCRALPNWADLNAVSGKKSWRRKKPKKLNCSNTSSFLKYGSRVASPSHAPATPPTWCETYVDWLGLEGLIGSGQETGCRKAGYS